MAAETGCKLLAIDYRLVTEHPYPIPLRDSYHAAEWVYANREKFGLDPEIFILGGDSASGNLTATISEKMRDEGKMIFIH
jgi:acetyl esterase